MAAIGTTYTGLSPLLLPGQLETNEEVPAVVDTWSITAAVEGGTVQVPVVGGGGGTGDAWTAILVLESSSSAIQSGSVDSWAINASEQPTTLGVNFSPSVDTWSIQANEQPSSITGNATPQTSADTWSINFADVSLLSVFSNYTELGVALWPWSNRDGFDDKTAVPFAAPSVIDTWLATWTETPTDTVQVDTFDNWAITYQVEQSALIVTQPFPPQDTWALTWLEVSSVTASGLIALSSIDTWSIAFTPEGGIIAAGLVTVSDTWSATAADSSAVAVTSDQFSASDTWSVAFVLDSGSTTVVGNIPILSSDEWDVSVDDESSLVLGGNFPFASSDQWSLSFADDGFMSEVEIQVPSRRVIKVTGVIREVDIE